MGCTLWLLMLVYYDNLMVTLELRWRLLFILKGGWRFCQLFIRTLLGRRSFWLLLLMGELVGKAFLILGGLETIQFF